MYDLSQLVCGQWAFRELEQDSLAFDAGVAVSELEEGVEAPLLISLVGKGDRGG